MGAGASAVSAGVVSRELARPLDGSDLATPEDAERELRRIRALLRGGGGDGSLGDGGLGDGGEAKHADHDDHELAFDVDGNLRSTRWEEVKQLFERHATPGGFWELLQFEELLEHEEISKEEAAVKFAEADLDGDGKLTFQEFQQYLFDEEGAVEGDEVTKQGLTEADLYVRVRPMASEGGHSANAEVKATTRIKLHAVDAAGVTLDEARGRVHYKFMRKMIVPPASQLDMYRDVAAHYDEAITMQLTDVMMLAYGQTGTGKTHTMLGPAASLSSDEAHDDWGIFPRLTHTVLTRMNAITQDPATIEEWGSWRYLVTASAVEFRFGQGFDLLAKGQRVMVNAECQVQGQAYRDITKVSDLGAFIEEINHNKTVRKTKMNARSSRAHTALFLTLHQYGSKNHEYCRTQFTLLDLAGSERASKTGGKQMSSYEAGLAIYKALKADEMPPIGAQGFAINNELSAIISDAVAATERYKQHKKYKAPVRMTTDFNRFINSCYEGRTRLGLIVCLSPAPSNIGETWFSLNMGKGLSKLRCPLKKGRVQFFSEVLGAAQKKVQTTQQILEKTKAGSRFLPLKQAEHAGAVQRVALLERLAGAEVAHPDEAGAAENFAKMCDKYGDKYQPIKKGKKAH